MHFIRDERDVCNSAHMQEGERKSRMVHDGDTEVLAAVPVRLTID